jgi:hypothetical protein
MAKSATLATSLLDDADWTIRDIVIDTQNWLPGKCVLAGTSHVEKIDWAERLIYLSLPMQKIKASPAYEPIIAIPGVYDASLLT